jgi:hypothetical protein
MRSDRTESSDDPINGSDPIDAPLMQVPDLSQGRRNFSTRCPGRFLGDGAIAELTFTDNNPPVFLLQ